MSWTQPTGGQFSASGRECHGQRPFTAAHVHRASPRGWGHQAPCHTPTPVISKDRVACTPDPPLLELRAHEKPNTIHLLGACVRGHTRGCIFMCLSLWCAAETVDFPTEVVFWVLPLIPILDHDSFPPSWERRGEKQTMQRIDNRKLQSNCYELSRDGTQIPSMKTRSILPHSPAP